MRVLFTAAVSLLALAACQPATPAAPTAEDIAKTSAELTAWFDAEYEEELQMSPIGLTFQGRKDQYDKLDDYSEAAIDKKLEWRRASVAEMKEKFDPAKLDEDSRTSFDIWSLSLDMEEKGAKFRRSPYIFVKDGPHVFLPNFMINFHEVSEKSDMDAYVARLGEVARVMDQAIELAKLAAAEGNRAPRFAYDQSIQEAKNVIAGAPFGTGADSPLWADVKSEIKKLQDGGKLTAEEATAVQASASAALTEKLKPAYERIIAWLEADKPNTPEQAQGASALKDGVNYYNTMLELQTTTNLTADEIHNIGLKEVDRIHAEMEKIKEQVGFKGTLQEFFTFMRTSPQFQLGNDDAGRAKYIKMSEDYLGAMEAKLPEYFGLLPKAKLVVKRVEAFREEPGGAQHYFPGTPDGARPGVFYAHLSDMKAMPTYSLEAIAYHEGVPGHHLQISIAQELTGIPKFRTQYGYTAYQEGWGLYSEALAKDMGFYTDPYSDFGRLGAEIWRAIRLVVDTGIHSKGWTEEQAVKYFLDNGPTPEGAVRSEIRRYIVWPGQATCYKIGMLKIQELRALAQTELGDKFTYAGFHDTVLGGGALPLPVLEARVKRWIEKTKTAA
ncbi:MAG TPA: DUF885 domain-containing protein [Hyphomonadaceae bacterium]|nr:DUF885 domain-containing protein [Hyphomonadaceae bacterium]HPI48482.1 DUF885 domain-containing protein [Hyphomonadaceae bacterium]